MNGLTIKRRMRPTIPAADGRPPRVLAWWVTAAVLYLLLIIVLAGIGGSIAPYDAARTNISRATLPPAFVAGGDPAYLLGTDYLGRDLLSRLLAAIRVTVFTAGLGTLISAVVGVTVGMVAGQMRGHTDNLLMMLVDIQGSLPFIVFALTALALLGSSFGVVVLVIGLSGWETYARLTRGMVLSITERDYVLAARSLGITTAALYRRYLLPHLAGTLTVQFTISLSGTILLESALSFLGLGIVHPISSLGGLLGEGRTYLLFAPWLSLVPSAVIFLLILSISVVGDWLRDALDPIQIT